jgi:catechol 2,3-dioxygenase-like lactoylglutathione lyase family enzyme
MVSVRYEMTVLFVSDVSISKDFYQNVFSLEVEHDFGENIVFKDAFSIWQRKRVEEIVFGSNQKIDNNGIKNVELYFETAEIDKIWEKIKAKEIEIIHGLKEEPWGQRTLRFFDPDHYIIEVAEPLRNVVLRLVKEGLPDSKIAEKTQIPPETVKKIRNSEQV